VVYKYVYSQGRNREALDAGKILSILGGADLFVRIEVVPNAPLPNKVEGSISLDSRSQGELRTVYFVGRESDGDKVITSPLFFDYK
jgi:hypothetical protein